ncbi:MAG: shikimate kinase [Bacteroidota bacterium]
MASGKSWLGQELALTSGLTFIDIDELFEERYRITILDFFDKYGEVLFRKLERQMLRETGALENIVIATGGGAPCFFDNMEFILKSGRSLYLRMEVQELMSRIVGIKKKRPLLKDIEPSRLETYVKNQLAEREYYYLQANYVFDGPDYPMEEILKVLRFTF